MFRGLIYSRDPETDLDPYDEQDREDHSYREEETMRLQQTVLSFAAGLMLLTSAAPAVGQDDEQVAREVIAATRAEWDAALARRPAEEIWAHVAEDYTGFSMAWPTRLDGKELNLKVSEAFAGDAVYPLLSEMADPKVQVFGEVAVLTYQYVGAAMQSNGEAKRVNAKSTRVYVKRDGRWLLVHANYAPLPSGG